MAREKTATGTAPVASLPMDVESWQWVQRSVAALIGEALTAAQTCAASNILVEQVREILGQLQVHSAALSELVGRVTELGAKSR